MSKQDRDDFVDFCTCEIERTWYETTGHSLSKQTFIHVHDALDDWLPVKMKVKKNEETS
jgi:hypothetical protein